MLKEDAYARSSKASKRVYNRFIKIIDSIIGHITYLMQLVFIIFIIYSALYEGSLYKVALYSISTLVLFYINRRL